MSFAELLTAAFAEAVRRATAEHLAAGRALPTWRDGKVVYVSRKIEDAR